MQITNLRLLPEEAQNNLQILPEEAQNAAQISNLRVPPDLQNQHRLALFWTFQEKLEYSAD